MQRASLRWSTPPDAVYVRRDGAPAALPPAPLPRPVVDLQPLLKSIADALAESELRRSQSLGEMQQVAIELAIAAASQLVHHAIERGDFGIEQLVREAVTRTGLDSAPVMFLHPLDLDLLRQRLAGGPAPWPEGKVEFKADAAVSRGGCRVESVDGRMLVSDISSRLSEIRRHWMEELDDAQIERRGTAGEGRGLRRFPDRRETA